LGHVSIQCKKDEIFEIFVIGNDGIGWKKITVLEHSFLTGFIIISLAQLAIVLTPRTLKC